MEQYEWDEDKNDANRLKHGIGFEAVYAFDWTSAVFELDERYAYGEDRFRAFGRVAGRPYCVAYTVRTGRLRIISLRPMHEKEASRYDI